MCNWRIEVSSLGNYEITGYLSNSTRVCCRRISLWWFVPWLVGCAGLSIPQENVATRFISFHFAPKSIFCRRVFDCWKGGSTVYPHKWLELTVFFMKNGECWSDRAPFLYISGDWHTANDLHRTRNFLHMPGCTVQALYMHCTSTLHALYKHLTSTVQAPYCTVQFKPYVIFFKVFSFFWKRWRTH